MDHNAFEASMIEAVNRNAADMEAARLEALLERQQNEEAHKARMMRIRKKAALREIVATGIISLGIIAAMLYLSLSTMGLGVLPEAICALVGLAAGTRLTALARAFRK